MISMDAIRTAVFSDMPWSKLDELVRAEMAAGRLTRHIADELAEKMNDVWGLPGIPEDGQNAYGDTLDALTGNCHSDCCYKDPPITPVESAEVISSRPR
jgi:hypothetical protein